MDADRGLARRTWLAKFRDAFRGVRLAFVNETSFRVHLPVASIVALCAWWFRVSAAEWCVLLLCIALVLVAELFNSAIESLARSLQSGHDERIGTALDIASGAVLLAAGAAAIVGMIVFVPYFLGP